MTVLYVIAGVLALALLIYLFAFKLGLFPPSGMGHGSLIFLVLPALPLIIVLAGYLPQRGVASVAVVIAVTGWAWGARVLRAQTLSDGEALGWSSILPSASKQFQARALGSVRALAFDGARLREAADQDNSFGYALMRRLIEVVTDRVQAMRMQMLDMYSTEPKEA